MRKSKVAEAVSIPRTELIGAEVQISQLCKFLPSVGVGNGARELIVVELQTSQRRELADGVRDGTRQLVLQEEQMPQRHELAD